MKLVKDNEWQRHAAKDICRFFRVQREKHRREALPEPVKNAQGGGPGPSFWSMSRFDPRLRKPVDKCGVTKKRRFRSPYQAQALAMKLGFKIYFCRLCGGYHLTSKVDTSAPPSGQRTWEFAKNI